MLSQTTGYAIVALGCLQEVDNGWTLARDIAECTGVPQSYLSQVLHKLAGSGLIHAKRGYRGGFALARPATQISLWDVATAVEGEDCLPGCLLGLESCPSEDLCPTHDFWAEERQRIEAKLRELTLLDVSKLTQTLRQGTCRTCGGPIAADEDTAADASCNDAAHLNSA